MLKPKDLTTNPLFRGFDVKEIEKLLRFVEERSYNKGDFIFKQNEEAHKLYIIEKGMVNILLQLRPTTQLTIATETSGGALGWSAIIPPHQYTADAKCLEPCQLLALDGAKVRELCYQEPDLGVKLMENLACLIAKRLQNTDLALVGAMWE
jgi:CRP/FNR family cyclic AMP-dependent transcriptional regulator